jgi:hypothetical protein
MLEIECKACGEKIMIGTPFILDGKYPGYWDRGMSRYSSGLDYYGDCFHRECFIKTELSVMKKE